MLFVRVVVLGVYTTWSDCEKQVKGYGGAIYKSFRQKPKHVLLRGFRFVLSDFVER